MRKTGIRKFILHACAFFLAFLLASGSVRALAWYVDHKQGARLTSVSASEGDMPDIHAWMFNVTNEETGMTFIKTGTWVDALDSTSTSSPKAIRSVAVNGANATTTERYQFTSLHLGTVDNLLELSNDNYFYVRLDVTDPAYQGRKVKAAFSLSENNVTFYDQNGTNQTSSLSSAIGLSGSRLFTEFVNLFVVECATSSQALDPVSSYAALSALFQSGAATRRVLTRNAAAVDLFAADATGPYYVYFRFSPDLTKCFDATETITTYMPCEILFDVTLNLEFYEIHH